MHHLPALLPHAERQALAQSKRNAVKERTSNMGMYLVGLFVGLTLFYYHLLAILNIEAIL